MENISNNMLRRQLKVYKVKNFVTGNYGYVPKVNINIAILGGTFLTTFPFQIHFAYLGGGKILTNAQTVTG